MPKALPASPFLANGYPSKVVAADAEVPGVLIKIAVIDPANVAETYIVDKTAMACTGSIVNVNGSNNAAPVVAPRPGKTPIITPRIVVAKINPIKYGSMNTDAIADIATSMILSIYP
jgi:hypothetical protein